MIKKLFFTIFILAAFLPMPLSAQGKETLAVLDFTTEAVSEIEMNAIVEYLSSELFNTDKYIVIDVSQRQTILNEMEFSMSGCSDETCALEIGKMLSAELIVVGNLSKVGSRYLMSVKMLQTETSRTMGTANGKFNDLDELIDGLTAIAFKLAGEEDGVKAAAATKPESAPAPAVQAELETEPVKAAEQPTEEKESPDEAAKAVAASAKEKKKESAEPAVRGDSTVPAIVCTAGGVAAIGVGGYFMYSLFTATLPAYEDATDAYSSALPGDDFEALWNTRLDSYHTMSTDFWVGIPTAAVGAVLLTIGIILFPPPDNEATAISFLPIIADNPGLIVRVSY